MKLKNGHHLAHQDHGPARHRRATPAPGRPHQAQDRQGARRWTSASPSCPTLFGEKIVMRLLDKGNLQLDMTKLGFEEKPLADFMHNIQQAPSGWCWSPGPTGSGKTTTLYSALSDLNQITENISTAEDPVEYNLPASTRCRCTTTSASTSPPRCARSCGRTPTSSWSARSATSRRPRSPSRRRSPATWCSRRCTPTTRPRR